eukprot:Em0005g1311a
MAPVRLQPATRHVSSWRFLGTACRRFPRAACRRFPGQPAGGFPGQPAGGYSAPPTGYQGYAGENRVVFCCPLVLSARARPPGVDPTFYAWFTAVDTDRSGSISLTELQRILSNNNWTQFSEDTCRLMITLFDHSHNR